MPQSLVTIPPAVLTTIREALESRAESVYYGAQYGDYSESELRAVNSEVADVFEWLGDLDSAAEYRKLCDE